MGEKRWARILATTHEMHVAATVLNYRGEDMGYPMLPVESLRWNLDATARPTMTADLTVPLMDSVHDVWWGPETSDDPLTPYGNMLELNLEIIGYDEIDHCRLGFLLIDTVTMNRPNNSINLHCVDLTDVLINRKMKGPKPNKAQSDADMSDWDWFNKLLDDAGFRQWKRTSDGSIWEPHEQTLRRKDAHKRISRTHKITKAEKWTAGTTYMDALDDLAGRGATPSYLFLDRNGTLRVRRPALLDIALAPTGAAHVISSGPGGTLSEVTSVLTRSGAINSLTVRNDHPTEHVDNIAVNYYIDKGPMRRGRVSPRNAVEETSNKWTKAQVKEYTKEKLQASSGARRKATVRGMINPYIEPGSAVQFILDGQKETFTARSISLSLPDGLMTVEAQGWVDEQRHVHIGIAPDIPQDPEPPPPEEGKYPDSHRFNAVEKGLNNGPGTEKSVKNTTAALRAVAAKFPKITDVGGYRSGGAYHYHPHGLALDIMMPPGNDAPNHPDLGNEIVKFFIRNQKKYGVDYIMWRHRIWDASYGNMEYGKSRRVNDRGSPTQNHMDHIHLNMHPYADYKGRVDEIRKGTYWKSKSEEYDEDFIKPMSSMIYTTGYWYGQPAGHNAVDYNTHGNGDLRVISDGGKVTVKATSTNGDNWVKLAYELPGGTLTTAYHHMTAPATRPQGTKNLKKGFVIGHMGATGNAFGAHLHLVTWFEGSYFNPLEVFKALRAPFGGPSHGADLSQARMETLRRKFFNDKNWKGVNDPDLYRIEGAGSQ